MGQADTFFTTFCFHHVSCKKMLVFIMKRTCPDFHSHSEVARPSVSMQFQSVEVAG